MMMMMMFVVHHSIWFWSVCILFDLSLTRKVS
jgi:hypothetical protein